MSGDRPTLTVLRYANREVWCERCGRPIRVGDHVGWWMVPASSGGTRRSAFCGDCHREKLRAHPPTVDVDEPDDDGRDDDGCGEQLTIDA